MRTKLYFLGRLESVSFCASFNRVNRGNNGASNGNHNNSWNVNTNRGWRPASRKASFVTFATVTALATWLV